MQAITSLQTILYVRDQQISADFYQQLLGKKSDLHLPGMTEFILSENCKPGLMPNSGIAGILQDKVPHPDRGNGIPRCELYFMVGNVDEAFENALLCRAVLISSTQDRNWGHRVCYFADPDGHIIAFAQTNNQP